MLSGIISNLKKSSDKFHCDLCDYKGSRNGDLLGHMKSIHEGVKFPCGQCDYKATEKRSLAKHVQSIHKGWQVPFMIRLVEDAL